MTKMKDYAYFKTAAKTARINSLAVAEPNGKFLYDFSLLDGMEISEQDKETIKSQSFVDESLILHFCESFYCKDYNNFESCVGRAYFNTYRINNAKTGKLLYRVYQLIGIDHISQERGSIYSDYRATTSKRGEFYGLKFEVDI